METFNISSRPTSSIPKPPSKKGREALSIWVMILKEENQSIRTKSCLTIIPKTVRNRDAEDHRDIFHTTSSCTEKGTRPVQHQRDV